MDGIIIVNKPKDWTSHDIVAKVKKITGEKVGHTGTLDPLATGVLPLLIGKGTLCSKYLINHDKKYIVTLKLGIKKSTGDEEGKTLEQRNINKQLLEKKYVENILQQFVGEQEQIPPIYSSIKVRGKKLYEYARKNQEVEIPIRRIIIYNIKLLEISKEKCEIKFEVNCSKGTYIRSLCEDIAKKMDTVGYMKELKRIEVGNFNIKNAIEIENLEKNEIEKSLITVEEQFKDLKNINLNIKQLAMFLNGVKLKLKLKFELNDDIYKIYCEKKFIGIGIVKNKQLKRDIIIN